MPEPPAQIEPADGQPISEKEPEKVWMTVKQFADAANVSTQRIYQRLAKGLQSYCKEEKGTKYLDSAALALFLEPEDLQRTCKALAKDLPTTCKGLAKGLQTPCKEECAAEKAAAESKVNALTLELDAARAELLRANEQRETAERNAADRDALKEQIQDLKTQRDSLQAELLQLRKDLDAVKETEAQARIEAAQTAERLHAAQDRADKAETALDAVKAQNQTLTDQLAAIADKQADALRAGAAEQLALAIPADQSAGQEKRGFFARLFHREKKE